METCANCGYFTLDEKYAEHIPANHPHRERLLRGHCSAEQPEGRVSSSYKCEEWTPKH